MLILYLKCYGAIFYGYSISVFIYLKSSADKYVSPSEFTEIEFMWYVCAFAKIRRGDASTINSIGRNTGTWKCHVDFQTYNLHVELVVYKSNFTLHLRNLEPYPKSIDGTGIFK